MTNRTYKVTEQDGGLVVTDARNGEVCDWISLPSTGNPGDTDSYVVVTERPEAWSVDMRWMVTIGQPVRQTSGLEAGRVGTIVGQGRSRKADRQYAANLQAAKDAGRDLEDIDFEVLIDNEGPLIRFEGQDELEWFPGQSFCFEPVTGLVPSLGGGSERV